MEPNKPAKPNYLAGVSLGARGHIPYVIEIPLEHIRPDPDQPRKFFDEEELQALATSIREKGLINPILVRHDLEMPGTYIIIAGERRYHASLLAGLPSIGATVSTGDPAELSLIENLVRVDLNPVEEAEAIERLMQSHGYTQEAVAIVLGKSRVAVTEILSILKLPAEIRNLGRTMNVRKSALTQLARMDDEKRGETVQRWQAGETVSVREITGIKKGTQSTPVKLALRALYASITRLGQIEGELKIDELAALRDARMRANEAIDKVTRIKRTTQT